MINYLGFSTKKKKRKKKKKSDNLLPSHSESLDQHSRGLHALVFPQMNEHKL